MIFLLYVYDGKGILSKWSFTVLSLHKQDDVCMKSFWTRDPARCCIGGWQKEKLEVKLFHQIIEPQISFTQCNSWKSWEQLVSDCSRLRWAQNVEGQISHPHLHFVLLLLGDFGEQFGFLSGESVDQRVTLCHETRLDLHAALLKQHVARLYRALLIQNMKYWTYGSN